MAGMIFNLTNASVSLAGGSIKLGPCGTATDRAEITSEQAADPGVITMCAQMRIRVMGVEAAAQLETAEKKTAATKPAPKPKAEPKPEPKPEPEPEPKPEPKLETKEEEPVKSEATTNDTDFPSTEYKGKKSKKSRNKG